MTTIPLLAENPRARDLLAGVELLYSDLDGTLLGIGGTLLADSDGRPGLATAAAIADVNRAGLEVVITTGRNRIQTAEISRLLGWRGFIAELGCVIVPDRGADPIYYTGTWPEGAVEPGDTPFAMIERAGAFDRLREAFPGRIEAHSPHHYNREATQLLRGNIDVDEAKKVLATLDVAVDILDNGIIHPPATGLVGVSEVHAYHLLPSGVHKPGAVAADLARRGLERKCAGSIGDSPTDVEMADSTALCAIVANGLAHAGVPAAASSRENVFALTGERGKGWAEFAEAWLDARGAARS